MLPNKIQPDLFAQGNQIGSDWDGVPYDTDRNGNPNVFNPERNEDGLWLNNNWANPDKVFIKTFSSGIDFLGWVHFPMYRVLRTSTKRRMFKKLDRNSNQGAIASYKGLLSHGNTFKLLQKIADAGG